MSDIRLARAHEIAALQEIERRASVRFDGTGLFDDWVGESTEYPASELEAGVRNQSLWVADADGAPVGFALAKWCGRDAHLHELDVLPEFGQRGIGTALVHQVLAWAHRHEAPRVTLTTFRDVPWNAPFYARLGFAPLAPHELTDELRAEVEHEAALGLRVEDRVVMARAPA